MTEESRVPGSPSVLKRQAWYAPHRIALILMWLLSTVTLIIMLTSGVRQTGQYRDERDILQAAYVLVLIWYLFRTSHPVKQLPDLDPVVLPKRRIGRLIPFIVLAFLFVGELIEINLVELLLIPAVIWVLIAWRREIGLPTVLIGIGVASIAFLAGLPFTTNQHIGIETYSFYTVLAIPMFIAGSLLYKRTGLGGSALYTRRFVKAGLSFLWGCVLFIPLGLTNAASGSPGSYMTWVDHWWTPLTQPLFSGIVEEAWWRLFTVSLAYFLLRPAFNKRPAIAVVGALLFSAIPFGLGHGGTWMDRVLMTGLLFGLPMAVVFARRDWEHAIGAHYMINMIPTLMVFLKL